MKRLPPFWETERMTMREITKEDTAFIVMLREDPNVFKFFLDPHPLQRQEHLRWFEGKYILDDRQSSYIARLKPGDLPVGVFSTKEVDLRTIEISYILAPNARGKGFATEAIQGLEHTCIRYSNISDFLAQIHMDNAPSIKLINRLGYSQKERHGDFIVFHKKA